MGTSRGQARLGLVVAMALLLGGCWIGPVRNRHVPQPAKLVVTAHYLGHWVEVARYDQGFEQGCEEATADYTLRPDGRIAVVNACRKDGALRTVRGVATPVPGSGDAKLKVRFPWVPVAGDYWVQDHDDGYSWSIVGEGSGRFLWLLSRTPLDGPQRDALIARAAALGYDVKALHLTRQAVPR